MSFSIFIIKQKKILTNHLLIKKMQYHLMLINFLKRYVVNGLVDSTALDSAFPKKY